MFPREFSRFKYEKRSEQTDTQTDVSKKSGKIQDHVMHAFQTAESDKKGKAKEEYKPDRGRSIDENGNYLEKIVHLTSEYKPGFHGALAGTPGESQHFRKNYLTEEENKKRKEYRNTKEASNHEGYKYHTINYYINRYGLKNILPYIMNNFPEERDRMNQYMGNPAESSSSGDQINFAEISREERCYMLCDRLNERYRCRDGKSSNEYLDIRGFMRRDDENKMTNKEYKKYFLPRLHDTVDKQSDFSRHDAIRVAGDTTYKQR